MGQPALRVALRRQLVSFITLLSLVFVFPPRSLSSPREVVYLLALGTVGTALAQDLFLWLISQIRAVKADV